MNKRGLLENTPITAVQKRSNTFLSSGSFRFFMKKVVLITAFLIPLLAGYIEYCHTYRQPQWVAFLDRLVITMPFSFGLLLSLTKLGRKFRFFTSIVIILSAIIRSPLVFPPQIAFPIFIIEIYALYSLFSRDETL